MNLLMDAPTLRQQLSAGRVFWPSEEACYFRMYNHYSGKHSGQIVCCEYLIATDEPHASQSANEIEVHGFDTKEEAVHYAGMRVKQLEELHASVERLANLPPPSKDPGHMSTREKWCYYTGQAAFGREMAKLMCPRCEKAFPPIALHDGIWWHEGGKPCFAGIIHNALISLDDL